MTPTQKSVGFHITAMNRKRHKEELLLGSLRQGEAVRLAKSEGIAKELLEEMIGRHAKADRIIANRKDVDSNILEMLSHSSDRITRRNVASNANSEWQTLLHLAPQFPAEFLSNPQLGWRLMNDASCFQDLDDNVLAALVKRDNCPAVLLRWAGNYGSLDVQLSLTMNKHVPIDILVELADSEDIELAEAASAHQKLQTKLRNTDLEELFSNTVKELLLADITDEWRKRYIGLAQFPYLSLYARALVSRQSASRAMNTVARNPDTSPAILNMIAERDFVLNHFALLQNPSCPGILLTKMVEQSGLSHSEIEWIAVHPNCPSALLKYFSVNANRRVREAMASIPSCSISLLRQLAMDKEPSVRGRVASALHCPRSLLQQLAKDGDDSVRTKVVANQNCPSKLRNEVLKGLAESPTRWIRMTVAENPTCPRSVLTKLAGDNDREVCAIVARHPGCPPRVLKSLSGHRNINVRAAVAQNMSCPQSALETLAADRFSRVRVSVARNRNCPSSLRSQLRAELDELESDQEYQTDNRGQWGARPFLWYWNQREIARSSHCDSSLLTEFAENEDEWIRQEVAENPDCPVSLLEKLSSDSSALVRREVAANTNCPVALLHKLQSDRDWSVVRNVLARNDCEIELRAKKIQRILRNGSIAKRVGLARSWGADWLDSPHIIQQLATDSNRKVREAAAANPSIPRHIYKRLSLDCDEKVRLAAGLNILHPYNSGLIRTQPQASPWFESQIEKVNLKCPGIIEAANKGNYLFPAPMSHKAYRCKSLIGRIIALSQIDAPPGELARASGYRDWRQRMAIARNPNTPPQILKKLSHDSNRYVAAQASVTIRGQKK